MLRDRFAKSPTLYFAGVTVIIVVASALTTIFRPEVHMETAPLVVVGLALAGIHFALDYFFFDGCDERWVYHLVTAAVGIIGTMFVGDAITGHTNPTIVPSSAAPSEALWIVTFVASAAACAALGRLTVQRTRPSLSTNL